MAGFGGWGPEAMTGCNTAILFHFLGNLKKAREDLWDKGNCLVTREKKKPNPNQETKQTTIFQIF